MADDLVFDVPHVAEDLGQAMQKASLMKSNLAKSNVAKFESALNPATW